MTLTGDRSLSHVSAPSDGRSTKGRIVRPKLLLMAFVALAAAWAGAFIMIDGNNRKSSVENHIVPDSEEYPREGYDISNIEPQEMPAVRE